MASLIVCVACMYVTLVSIAAASEDEVTYIRSMGGRNEDQCINGGMSFPCCTLSYVADNLNSNSSSPQRIQIEDPGLVIYDSVTFSGVDSVTLEGSPEVITVLRCDCHECGLRFEHSQNITIRYLTITGCGGGSSTRGGRPAMVVYDCYNFAVEKSNVSANVGMGLSIIDTYGNVVLRDSFFQYNGMCSNCKGASGLLMMFATSYNNTPGSNYTIENCHMTNNNHGRKYFEFSSGGGIMLTFRGRSMKNTVVLRNVTLEGNGATWGGGMFIQFSKDATNNMVILDRVTFKGNRASKAGGGLDVGYTGSTSSPPITNRIYTENCNFTTNIARYGGGTAIYASQTMCARESDHSHDALVFRSCVWEGNAGSFGSAVDISPFVYDTLGSLYFPHPKFVDCSFIANQHSSTVQNRRARLINVGAFMVYGFGVEFEGYVDFQEHTLTALHITQSSLTFLPGTNSYFLNNSGLQGGAMSLHGSSSLCVFPNTTLTFRNNRAQTLGGAIYQSTQNQQDFVSSRTCFIQNCGSNVSNSDTEPVFTFDGNSAGQVDQAGQSMYATTFRPCYYEQFNRWSETNTVTAALQKIAVFNFSEQTEGVALATAGVTFSLNGTMPIVAVPGKVTNIPLKIMDELHNEVPTVYRVVVDGMCKTDRKYMLNDTAIYGAERSACNLTLVAVSFRETSFRVEIRLQKCPPGFHMQEETCICSAYSKKHAYYGIDTCHDQQPYAFLSNRFWVGYDVGNESLLTALCPFSFCVTNRTLSAIPLPQSPSPAELNQAICEPNRTGWLCGKCQANHTAYYHSPSYQCAPQKLCVCGVFFYLLSEVFPIVVMFSVIAFFDIRFTTGTASGLVFFAQTIDTVTLNLKWNSKSPKYIDILSIPYKVVYGLFNFDFFNLEQASFCLWKDATVMDVIAFRYISVVFAFVLLLLIVLFLKYCTCYNCCRLTKNSRLGKTRSVIHSMSAVLVICYAQCTNISLQILAKATLRGAGREPRHDVTLFGGIQYFHGEHILYAVAACFCLSTVVAIPPLLLLVYPGYLSLFSFCKLNETRPLLFISDFFIKLKPFFDSFQGCYRDKLRFFSALYFVSRIAILSANAFIPSTSQSIILIVLIIILILGAYTMFHPFHKASDNINNGLILLNMSLIGCLTMLAYSQDRYEDQRQVVLIALTIRLVLLYLPIVCIGIYVIKIALCWCFPKIRKKDRGDDQNDLANRSTDSSHVVIDHSYLPFQELSIDTSEPAPDDNELSYTYKDREDLLEYI